MKLVYSFWGKPLEERWSKAKNDEKFEDFKQSTLNCLNLSVLYAKRLGFRCEMVTDVQSYNLIKHLPFDKISTELTLLNYNGKTWVEGKIMAMALQHEPFIHIDWDVFLERGEVGDILKNFKEDLIVQSVDEGESFAISYKGYRNVCRLLDSSSHTIPDFTRGIKKAYNCGIVGFNNLALRDKYVNEFTKLKDVIDNNEIPDISVIVEQYLLYIVANRERASIKVLLDNLRSPEAKRIGYTHLILLDKYLKSNQDRIRHILKNRFGMKENIHLRPEIRLSLCTVVMNRKDHLIQTLKRNIEVTDKFEGIDLNVIDYNSTDNLLPELKAQEWFVEACRRGKLHFYQNRTAQSYHRTLPKNTIHFYAKGEYVVNVDADNFVTEQYLIFCLNHIKNSKNFFIRPEWSSGDSYGRILCKKSDFVKLGGYDLRFEKYGFEDMNLMQRLKNMGLTQIKAPAHTCISNIKHDDRLRIENEEANSSIYVSDFENRRKQLIQFPNKGKQNECETIKIKV